MRYNKDKKREENRKEKTEDTTMKITKRMIKEVNGVAEVNLDMAKGIVDGINMMLGEKKYGLLNCRVVFFENPNGSTAERYAHCHDAYCWADED